MIGKRDRWEYQCNLGIRKWCFNEWNAIRQGGNEGKWNCLVKEVPTRAPLTLWPELLDEKEYTILVEELHWGGIEHYEMQKKWNFNVIWPICCARAQNEPNWSSTCDYPSVLGVLQEVTVARGLYSVCKYKTPPRCSFMVLHSQGEDSIDLQKMRRFRWGQEMRLSSS